MIDFLDLVRQRLEMGARTIGIAESNEIDPRDGAEFARMIREELADVAAYAKLLDDRVQKTANRLVTLDDVWLRLSDMASRWRYLVRMAADDGHGEQSPHHKFALRVAHQMVDLILGDSLYPKKGSWREAIGCLADDADGEQDTKTQGSDA